MGIYEPARPENERNIKKLNRALLVAFFLLGGIILLNYSVLLWSQHKLAGAQSELEAVNTRLADVEEQLSRIYASEQKIRKLIAPIEAQTLPGPRTTGNPKGQAQGEDAQEAMARRFGNLNIQAAIILKNLEEAASIIADRGEILNHFPTEMPVTGFVASRYGYRKSPFGRKKHGLHKGIDIGAPKGAAIHAGGKGIVTAARYSASYGYYVDINHGNGIETRYAHASRLLVRRGDIVEMGDVIAKVGSTGRSTGPHLHYEIRLNGKPVNPETYMYSRSPLAEARADKWARGSLGFNTSAMGGGDTISD